ncbi:hypothetical protein Avbf_18795 [Armadillidium vulgare]|nr:hypothetical protein Avbf_18795 [Armadillidium vulgare]
MTPLHLIQVYVFDTLQHKQSVPVMEQQIVKRIPITETCTFHVKEQILM